ncbi:MAG: hypothetical protein IMY71_02265 [Bacteroidetes bacterium]|nr:hypothetical protein [Bacteroidota bacterium]
MKKRTDLNRKIKKKKMTDRWLNVLIIIVLITWILLSLIFLIRDIQLRQEIEALKAEIEQI